MSAGSERSAVPPATFEAARGERSDSEGFWYFAYGSNMQRETFLGRRGMRPVKSVCARLDGWRLCFDLPVGAGERGVANVVVYADDHVCGVLHLITAAELERLERSEGVDRGWYRRVEVDVTTLDGERLRACTLTSGFAAQGRKPSARYLGLLLEGARQHGLPAEWIARLEAFERAIDERVKA
jgi:hypothetical protein